MGTSTDPGSLAEILASLGAAGRRLDEIGAAEAGAGNMSVAVAGMLDLADTFPQSRDIDLPIAVPALAGHTILVTGSGCRLRSVADDPLGNVGAVVVHDGGRTGTLHLCATRGFTRPTSEFNSHLAVHDDHVGRRGVAFHAVLHAQPPHLTLLSHMPGFQSTEALTHVVLRWQPETIIALPEGVAYLPFMVPGSGELMGSTVAQLRAHQVVVWAKHGAMARSDASPLTACDKIEYAEAGAHYAYLNLCSGGRAQGLSDAELRRIAAAFNVPTTLY